LPQSSKYNVTFLEAARNRRAIELFTPSYHLAIGNKPSLLVIILTVDGELAAVLVPIRDADMETVSLSLNPNFIAMYFERIDPRKARTTQLSIPLLNAFGIAFLRML
jgi:hypothetical protein